MACSNSNKFSNKEGQTISDTTFVAIDSSTINTSENSFEFVLYFLSNGKQHEIFRERNRDYSVEFDSIPYSFKNDSLNIEEYEVHDLPTGRDKSIIRDKNSNIFYLTDWYNNNSGSDTIMLSKLDFNTDSITVKSSDSLYPDYKVNLKKVWTPN
ncbi:MAG: hypothetical protein ACK50L_05310 [Bacteroidota bacterium]